MGDGSRKELEALKKALACILQEENPLPPPAQQAREAELSRRLSSSSSHDSPSPPAQDLHPHDLSILSRLLSQVHDLMEGENGGELLMRSKHVEKPDFHDHSVGTEKNMVEAVVEIASAAAEAAKAAAASTGKNVELMETVLSNSGKNVRPSITRNDEDGCTDEALEDESSKQPIIDKDIVKRLERQNRITHWVLGFMIVATAIWRFKMLSMILGVRKTFTNPFQTLGDMVSGGFKGQEDQNGGGNGFHKARTVLPSILGGEEKEITKKTEKTEHSHSITEDFKIGEALTFSLDSLLSAGRPSENHASEGAQEEGSSKE